MPACPHASPFHFQHYKPYSDDAGVDGRIKSIRGFGKVFENGMPSLRDVSWTSYGKT
jgi:hypothetical protein